MYKEDNKWFNDKRNPEIEVSPEESDFMDNFYSKHYSNNPSPKSSRYHQMLRAWKESKKFYLINE